MAEVAFTLKDRNQIGERIRTARIERDLTQDGLAKLIDAQRKRMDPELGCSRAAVGQWEINRTKPDFDMIQSIASVLKISPAYIAFGLDTAGAVAAVEKRNEGIAFLQEIRFGDSMDDRQKVRQWGVPRDLVESVGASDDSFILQVETDALSPHYADGDRVIVDTSSTRPTGGGAYVYWDGVGAAFGFMQIVPGKKPMVKITGEGVDLDPIPLGDIVIIGKVRGRFSLG